MRLIDLEKATMQMVQSAGMENSKRIYCHVPAGSRNYPDGLSDSSHLQEEGASRIAGLFLNRLKASNVKEADFETVEEGDYSDLIAREDSVLC